MIAVQKKRTHIFLICLICLVVLILSLFLTPIGDDWGYSTIPLINRTFVMSARPLDSLFGFLLGEIPFAFPFLNHIFVVTGHCISSVMLYLIASNILGVSNKRSFLFAVVFAVSSTCCATVLSIDSINQSMSLCYGVVGIYGYMRWSQNTVVRSIIYLVFAILSTLSKESGIVFFGIIPLFDMYFNGLKATWKHTLVNCVLGGVFCLFFVKLVSSTKGIGTISILKILKNTVFHIGFSTLQLDTVSFFGYGKLILPIVTAVLCLPLLFFVAKTLIQKLIKKDWLVLFLVGLIVLSTFPQNLLSGTQEMNSYPTVFFMMLFFAYLCKAWDKKTIYCIIAPYLVAAMISSGIKYTSMYKLSLQSHEILNNIAEQTEHLAPRKTKVYAVNVFSEDSYGVYVLSPSGTIGYGHAVRDIYGYGTYVKVDYYHNRTDRTTIGVPDTLIHLPDEEFMEVLKEMAKNEVENNGFDLCLIIQPDSSITVIN